MRLFTILTLALLSAMPTVALAEDPANIRLAEVDGRAWLLDRYGSPFFAHGITHVGNPSHRVENAAVSKACKDLGFNAYGYGCPPALRKDMPYLEGRNLVPISTYRNDGSFRFIDIFDPEQQQQLEAQIKQACDQNRDNPNLIGYCWTDLGAWPLKNSIGKNWVDFIRDLPADAPGRRAYQAFLEDWQGDDPAARDLAFLRLIAREYFRVCGEANRKCDPHHLIFGDRFAFDTVVPEVLEEMLPWVDAIAIQPPFQPGFPKQEFDRIHRLTGKPILICDFAIRFKDGDKPISGWKLQENSQVAGQLYEKYVRDALETSYILGVFWCNLIDSQASFKNAGIKQGMFEEGLTPRPGLAEAVRELNRYREQVTPKGIEKNGVPDKAPTAKPGAREFTVTMDEVLYGSIQVTPPVPASGQVEAGTRLTISAEPDPGYTIDSVYHAVVGYQGWTLYLESMTSPFEVTVDQETSIGASFIKTSELEGFRVVQDVVYAQPGVKPLKYDVYSPDGAQALPCIVIIHGGGWSANTEDIMRGLARELVKTESVHQHH